MREGKKKKNNRRKGARITITIKLKKPPVSPRNETKRKWRERVIADFPFPKDGGRGGFVILIPSEIMVASVIESG